MGANVFCGTGADAQQDELFDGRVGDQRLDLGGFARCCGGAETGVTSVKLARRDVQRKAEADGDCGDGRRIRRAQGDGRPDRDRAVLDQARQDGAGKAVLDPILESTQMRGKRSLWRQPAKNRCAPTDGVKTVGCRTAERPLRETAYNLGIVQGNLLAYLFEGGAHGQSIVASTGTFRQAAILTQQQF